MYFALALRTLGSSCSQLKTSGQPTSRIRAARHCHEGTTNALLAASVCSFNSYLFSTSFITMANEKSAVSPPPTMQQHGAPAPAYGQHHSYGQQHEGHQYGTVVQHTTQQPHAQTPMSMGGMDTRNALNKPRNEKGEREWSHGLCGCFDGASYSVEIRMYSPLYVQNAVPAASLGGAVPSCVLANVA